jgi:hypothetical protein
VWFVSVTSFPVEPGEFAKFGGAHVNCWLVVETEAQAIRRATELVEGYGWRVESVDRCQATERAHYDTDSDDLEYFEQALIDGEVVVFHTWPNEAEDRGVAQ